VAHGRDWVMGEQLAQVDNRDPFAPPVWRSPVYRTPEPVIMVVQLVRLIWRVIWFALTHPGVDAVAALVVVTWLGLSWPGVAGLAVVAVMGLAGLRVIHPAWFARFVAVPVRDWLRWWFYRRRWKAAMTLAGLAPDYRGQPMLPILGTVHRAGAVDLVRVGLVTGQAPADFEARAENLAHAFGARLCRIRAVSPGVVMLELVRADTLADPIGALPVTGEVDLAGLPVGRCEDGSPWRLRLAATHVLIAGATGSGKGSVIWSLIRALLPAIAARWVQVWALDPKRMELSFGRALFHRYACHATAMVELLEAAVAEMHDRAGHFGGRTRTFTPSTEFPFLVVLVDELAFLTAYQPERDLRKRAEAAIATLTSQGRSVGVCVVGALQDPRKDVISLRNLFSTRIALRLDESDQVDMVLGDGARDRGALADQISPLPYVGAGVGYVRLEASPDPVRVRAAYVTDADIMAMADAVGYLPGGGL
jgi:DNA segregation ATPase FtsK/SpoIIIE, S-DNA-T family